MNNPPLLEAIDCPENPGPLGGSADLYKENGGNSDSTPFITPSTSTSYTTSSITSILPKSGLTQGGTKIEVIADGISTSPQSPGLALLPTYWCLFTPRTTEDSSGIENSIVKRVNNQGIRILGSVITNNRLLCISPPFPPGPISLSIYNTDNKQVWTNATFTYFPPLRLLTVYPLTVYPSGGTTVLLSISSPLPPDDKVYCRFGEDSTPIPALLFISPSTSPSIHPTTALTTPTTPTVFQQQIQCISPPGILSTITTLSIGSYTETWSNTLNLSIGHNGPSGLLPVHPNRGTHQGGTKVTIYLPSYWQFTKLVVQFGDGEVIHNLTRVITPLVPQAIGGNISSPYTGYVLLTPKGPLGQVQIVAYDAMYTHAPR